ncbi:MAG: single-stranded DNA-binding protein [Bacilli bacterium]
MLNQVVLVGRLVENPVVSTTETGKKYTFVTLAIARNFKNPDGIYESDFIRCVLWNGIASNTTEYCRSGDTIGIKGRLQTNKYEDKEKNIKYITEVIAEKVTFLSSQRKEEVKVSDKPKENKK